LIEGLIRKVERLEGLEEYHIGKYHVGLVGQDDHQTSQPTGRVTLVPRD